MMASVMPARPVSRQPQPGKIRAAGSDPLPPAILLGGGVNALSIARSLGRMGVTVHALNEPTAEVRHSRYCRWVPLVSSGDQERDWADFLLGPESEPLRGAVVLSASDAGIQVLLRHRAALQDKFLLDESNPDAQQRMLNKLATYRAAVAAGVPTPRFWAVSTADEVRALRGELVFPLLVKPQISHRFEQRFGKKYLLAQSYDELLAAFEAMNGWGIEVLLVERIPGLDDRLCSYYTYLDADGHAHFDFTKRVIRRYPLSMGSGCHHITDRNPAVRDVALRLFRHVGLRGLANAEFMLDERDGQLKLIECNARFTAANGLVAAAGLDLARFVYRRLVGLPPEPLGEYRAGLRLWYPLEDFKAFRALHRRGDITWPQWLRSILHRQTFPLFQWTDPMPSFVALLRRVRRLARGGKGRDAPR